jgi:tetratricopeptide (TPR) repeat protein
MRQFADACRMRRVPLHATSRNLVLAATACFAMAPGMAHALPAFEMAAAVDAPGGQYLADANYMAAVSAVTASRSRASPLERMWLESNACVAHTKLGQPERATAACDTALNLASMRYGASDSRQDLNRHLAFVHANRAILRRAAGNLEAAESDMQMALALAPKNELVQANAYAFAARREAMAATARNP